MTATPPKTAAAQTRARAGWRGRAYGLDVDAPKPLVGVPEATPGRAVGRTRIEFASASAVDERWESEGARRLFVRHFSDGSPLLTIDHNESFGYRVWAPYHGRHLVSGDGREILCAAPARSGWWWQRLVLAQVLPIAAALQGLDLLHASAVAFEDKAVAITAEAGTGKTSLAAHLLDLGADLLADDVLALQALETGIVAYPGVGLVNVDPRQRSLLGRRARRLLADVAGEGDKLYVVADVGRRPLPLVAVYFLQRGEFRQLRILPEGDARKLLGSNFIPYLDRSEHLLRHLDVCSRIAATIPPFVIEAPTDLPAGEIAAAVQRHGAEAW
jgi:hypothetical protein